MLVIHMVYWMCYAMVSSTVASVSESAISNQNLD